VNSLDLIQGTDAWKLIRSGKVTASRIADIMAQTKSGYGASRANYEAELISERLTGFPVETYQSTAMLHGIETEPQARTAYEFRFDTEVAEIGFVHHPTIKYFGCSPDGLIAESGLIEIKSPNTATHIKTLLGAKIPDNYIKQMMAQMACTGRQWCDWVSYDPRMPENMCLFVDRIERDDELIAELEKEVQRFLDEVAGKVSKLLEKYGRT